MWLPTFTLIALWIKSGIHCFSYCVRVVLWVLVKREGIVVIGNKKYLIRYKLVSQLTGSAKARPRLKQRGAPKKVPTNYLRPNFFSLFPKVICSFHYWLKSFFLLNIIVLNQTPFFFFLTQKKKNQTPIFGPNYPPPLTKNKINTQIIFVYTEYNMKVKLFEIKL